MNLVQLQERLKDLPMPALMSYANGQNPMVPPYLALTELKRRESLMQDAQRKQAMQQGQAPSVKEQVEQAAGLATLQKQQQAKGLQSLLGAGVQVPPVAEPRQQPTTEESGVAALPTEQGFEFAEGGIIGYAGEGPSYVEGDPGAYYRQQVKVLAETAEDPEVKRLEAEREALLRAGKPIEASKRVAQINQIRAAKEAAPTEAPSPTTATVPTARGPVPVKTLGTEVRGMLTKKELPKSDLTGDPQEVMKDILSYPDTPERQAIIEAYQRQLAAQGIKLPSREVPPAPPVAQPVAPGIPGLKQAQDIYTAALKAPTLEEAATTERGLAGLYGIDKQMGEEQAARMREMEAARAQSLQDRPMERLMRVLGGVARSGIAGAGPAYINAMEGERMSDAQAAAQRNQLTTALEQAKRKEAMERMGIAQRQFEQGRTAQMGAAKELMTLASQHERMTDKDEMFIQDWLRSNPGKTWKDGFIALQAAKAEPRAEAKQELSRPKLFADWTKFKAESPIFAQEYPTFETYYAAAVKGMGGMAATNPVRAQADAIIRGGK